MTRRTGKEGLHTRVVQPKKPKLCRFCKGPDHGTGACSMADVLKNDPALAAEEARLDAEARRKP